MLGAAIDASEATPRGEIKAEHLEVITSVLERWPMDHRWPGAPSFPFDPPIHDPTLTAVHPQCSTSRGWCAGSARTSL